MKPASRKKLQIGAAVAVVLIIVNVVATFRHMQRLKGNAVWVAHTLNVQAELANLRSTLIEAETGHRGFVITGDDAFLEPYERATQVLEPQIRKLTTLIIDNREQLVRLESLRGLSDQKLAEMRQTIEIRKQDGFEAAQAKIVKGVGTQIMNAARDILDEMAFVEERLLANRLDESNNSYWLAMATSIACGGLSIVGIALYLAMLRRFLRHREASTLAIAAKSELHRTTLASIGDGVITTDEKGLVTSLNGIAESLTGWRSQDAHGLPLIDVFQIVNETTRVSVENPVVRALNEGRIIGLANHTLLISKNGVERPIDDSAAPIHDSSGKITGCVLVFRDVTERRQVEKQLSLSEQTFRALIERAPIGIANTGIDGKIGLVNAMFCRIVGWSEEDLQLQDILNFTHPDDFEEIRRLVDDSTVGKIPSFEIEKRFVAKDGSERWVSISGTMIRDEDGSPTSLIFAVKDISDARKTSEIQNRLASIISSSNDAIISKSCDGFVMTWNPAAEKLYGYSDQEMLGRSIFEIVPQDRQAEERELLSRLQQGEQIRQFHTTRLRKDGELLDILMNISPILDSNGRIVGLSSISKDVTYEMQAAMELEASEKRFQTLADNISQFAWMTDADGSIYWYNKRWYDYTGTDIHSMQGWGWKSVHHPDHLERVVEKFRTSIEAGTPWEDTFPLRGKDGNYRWFLSRALPIRGEDGRILNWFGSNTDITELKEQEESLKKARETAEAASQARGEFLANMSHEIRTPMTAILGHADMLADSIKEPDDLQSVDTIRRNGKFLLQIINDILDLSKIDAGKFEIEPRDVAPTEVIAEIHSLMEVRAAEKGLKFETIVRGMIPKMIKSDPIRVRQVLLNLVGNAIKFTDHGTVQLEVVYLEQENALRFDVSDTGIGIPPGFLEKVFDPFTQADTSSTRAYEGTGLGLAISRRLARALGGDIHATSTVGKGSLFSFTLHCGKEFKPELVTAALSNTQPPPLSDQLIQIDGCVFLVDDRRDIRIIAQNFIEKAGGTVLTATNGQECIDCLLHSQNPTFTKVDIVVMDMQMPIMDGYTAVEILRDRGFTKPIIALTANAMKDDRDKCIECGCNDYITKPLDGPNLVHLIAKYIRQSRIST